MHCEDCMIRISLLKIAISMAQVFSINELRAGGDKCQKNNSESGE